MLKLYSLYVGWFLIGLAVFGMFTNPLIGVPFMPTSFINNIINLVIGVFGVMVSAKNEQKQQRFSRIAGICYTVMALTGFLVGASFLKSIGISSTTPLHIINVIIGISGLWLGFSEC